MKIGAYYSRSDNTCEFIVWAPFAEHMSLKLFSPRERLVPMQKMEQGYWRTAVHDVSPETHYSFYLNNRRERPDPASFYQSGGVHKASQIIDHASFQWHDTGWQGLPLSQTIMYEVHTGTFTAEGTFDAIIPRLDGLKDLGINALEIMPVAQFPGDRNWGYDGVYPFAVQNSYGGPDSLKKLVNACHVKGMAVILDVVYNHLGPEGNYLWDYGPYFTDRYKTPWGEAINFDGPYSNEVRNYFIENALYWFEHYHIDALRLDAVHGIYDMSATPFLRELAQRVRAFSQHKGRTFYLIAESDLNNSRVIREEKSGGDGLDATWCDDFHHSVHSLLTGELSGYYCDFGELHHLAKSMEEGYVYSGQYSCFRKRNHGDSSRDVPAERFVVFSQNHDQVGNRMEGERLASLLSFESLKQAAGIVIFSPYVPLLFMGEEYGERAPFLYFVSHSDLQLIEAVRQGRRKEFESFGWKKEPPDPQSKEAFMHSKLDWNMRNQGDNRILLMFYTELIRLRKEVPSLAHLDKDMSEVWSDGNEKCLMLKRRKGENRTFLLFNFKKEDALLTPPVPEGQWMKLLDSSEERWKGPGTLLPEKTGADGHMTLRGESFALYLKENT